MAFHATVFAFVGGTAAQADLIDGPDEFVARIGSPDIVILGEIHDNPSHHIFQAEVLAALSPTAVVFEMLDADEAGQVLPELADDADAMAEALDWENSGWPEFSMYFPLFTIAATRAVYGAEVPREVARAAFADGAAAVFGGDAAAFGLDQPLDAAEQSAREAQQQAAHCNALPDDILPGFVEAQRLRDAALAEAALTALTTHGAPVVVITGNGHARRDWGVPAVLSVAAPDVSVLSLGQFEDAPARDAPFDLWVVADAVDRPDPCAAFNQ